MAACAAQVDAQVRAVLGRVLAQRRSAEVAFADVAALSPGTRANCWVLAEAAGHEGQGRMQALVGSYVWDWGDLRAELAGLAGAWLPDREGDLIGPGIAIDETADLKAGDATACVLPQHAGYTGTTVPVCYLQGWRSRVPSATSLNDDQVAELHEDASARLREHLVLRGCSILRRSSRPASGARRCQDPGKMAP